LQPVAHEVGHSIAAAGFLPLGGVRAKKWKPFHNMYRANHLRELRKKQAEAEAAAREAQALDEFGGVEGASAAAFGLPPAKDEPKVFTTPFQATRMMRAFDSFPEDGATFVFWTRLNVDLTRESVRGTCNLPHGLAKKVKVLAFCPDHESEEMLKAGADFAGITDVSRRIGQGWLGFDKCLATPGIMAQVMKLARVLGPRKLMPNPKSGTVVANLRQGIQEAKSGTLLEYRAEGEGEVRALIGDAAFTDAMVLDNLKFLVQTLLRARPRGAGTTATAKDSAPAPLIQAQSKPAPGAGPAEAAKDAYFLEASLRLGQFGPVIPLDPETMLPASAGYYR